MKSWIGQIASVSGAHTWRVVFMIAAVIAILLGVVGLIATARVSASPAVTFALFLIGPLLGAGAATLFGHAGALCGQHARDLMAQALYEQLLSGEGEVPPFTLYLRPFASTDVFDESRLRVMPTGVRPGGGGGFIAPPERFELEAQVASAAQPFGPVVALGAPLEHFGAGRILVGDDAWREAITLLIRNAQLIILLPSSRAGTLWEVAKILNEDMLSRTIIIDPPNGSVTGIEFDHAAEWDAVRTAFAERGYALPDDDPKGLLVFFGAGREPERTLRLDITNAGRLRRFFREVLGGRG